MKKIIIANWKMNMRLRSAVTYAKAIRNKKVRNLEMVVAPSFTVLESVGSELKKSPVGMAAQNVAAWDEGSYTGEVSAKMAKEVGCRYVILGHSERRTLLSETDEMVRDKMVQVVSARMTPILCIGETAAEKKAGKRDAVLVQQIKQATAGVSGLKDQKLVVAYEPVWAIGSGTIVAAEDLESAYRVIRRALSLRFGTAYVESQVRFVYGGSVTMANVAPFWELPFVDGFLIGGASLDVKSFVTIGEMSQ